MRFGLETSDMMSTNPGLAGLDKFPDPFMTDIDAMDSSSFFDQLIAGPEKSRSGSGSGATHKTRESESTQRALERVQRLSHTNAITDGQRARIEVALHEEGHKHHASLVAYVLAARLGFKGSTASREASEDDVQRIMHTVAKISSVSRYEAEKSSDETDTSDKDICARIPPGERGKYPWCKQQPDEISTDVMDLIRLITKGKAQEVVDRALKQRGYSRYEIRKAAKQYTTTMKRVLQTHRAFDSNVDTTDASTVIDAVNDLAQNPDFVQHMIELMAMHLPPDYPWRADSITTVCKWWIMQYLSMVRPQLVHAVISCPDKDAYKCSLLGLSLGGSEPVVKWHGSSSVHVSTHGSDESQITVMISKAKWADVYKKFESDKRALRGGKRRGQFAKLDSSTRQKLNEMAKEVDITFKAAVKAAIEKLAVHQADKGPYHIFDFWAKTNAVPTAFGTAYGDTASSSGYSSDASSGSKSGSGSGSSTSYGDDASNSWGSENESHDSHSASFGKSGKTPDERRIKLAKDCVEQARLVNEALDNANTAAAVVGTPGTPAGKLQAAGVAAAVPLTALRDAIAILGRAALVATGPGVMIFGINAASAYARSEAIKVALTAAMSNASQYRPEKGPIEEIVSDITKLVDSVGKDAAIGAAREFDSSLFSKSGGATSGVIHAAVERHRSLFAETHPGPTGLYEETRGSELARIIDENAGKTKTMGKSDYHEKARECAGFVTFRSTSIALLARWVSLLLDGVYSTDDEDSWLLTNDKTAGRIKSGLVRFGVNLDGATISDRKHKSSVRKLLKPKFANQIQKYQENMLLVKSAVSTWNVGFLGTEPVDRRVAGAIVYKAPKASTEQTAVAMNVLTQIALEVADEYARSIQQFYETAGALNVSLTSSLITTKTPTSPEEESLFDQRSAEESDTETGDVSFFDDGY